MTKTLFSAFLNTAGICLILLCASVSYAVENCSQMGGKCRQNCAPNETAEQGAFIDCADKEECCVEASNPGKAFRCCIISADPEKFSASNCIPAIDGQCSKGIGNASECSSLIFCKQ